MGAMTVFAQVPTNQQLTYQTVVRNAQNQLVFNQSNVTVFVEVCKANGSVVWYSESHTGLSTNANGLLALMVGSSTSHTGNWADIDWSDAAIRTTITYDPGTGTVNIPSGLAPVTAVPYALQAGNASNITNLIGDAIHDSIVNNISEQIHDSIVNNLTNAHYVTETVMGNAIHDSIAGLGNDLTDLENRVNTFNTHVCDSVQDCIKDYLNDNHYVTETVMGNAIHDSIAGLGNDLTDLENRVNTFNTHVCDSVRDCVTGWIHDSIANNISDNISSQIHDSIVYNINNNISEQIHDSVSNYLTNNHYVTESNLCTAIENNCTNVAMRDANNTFTGNNTFSGSVTVPNAITPDLTTVLAAPCTQEAVNLCDLLAVFDSLNRRINELADEITALKNSIPPAANAPTVSNVTYTSMNVKANASSDGAAITSYEFCYSINSDMSGATCQTVQASDADNYTFTGLTPYTQYYVQYSATNFAGTTPSPIVAAHTPAHAPTADVTPPVSTKPAGFKVDVKNIDPKEKTDETTVQVCYTLKTGADCPEKGSADYAECKTVDATGVSDTTISVTGLTPSTEYCAIVKVSNGDSTSIYGPWSVTTGADASMTVANDGGGTVTLCGESTKDVTFTATITGDNASDFTFAWSAGTSTTSKDTVAFAAGTHTVTVTATHTTEGYTLTASTTVTVNSGATPTIGFCVDDENYRVSVKTASNVSSVTWGDGQSTTGPITTSTEPHEYIHSPATYNVTAYSESGCSVEKKVSLGGHNPYSCTVATAHTDGSTYTSTTGGLETVNGEGKVVSVQDQDGHTYAVTQIGDYCLIRTNLRTTKYSSETGTGNEIADGGSTTSNTAPYYYKPTSSSSWSEDYGVTYGMYNDSIFGYYYNWAAASRVDICPKGWHVPTQTEWQNIVSAAGASTTDGAVKLAGGCLWYSTSSSGTNPNNYVHSERDKWGFSAVPAGFCNGTTFTNAGYVAFFWSATQTTNYDARYRYVGFNNQYVHEGNYGKRYGFSVRCLRD